MDLEDDRPLETDPLRLLEKEDLELFSRADLGKRIERLRREIARAERQIEKKGSSHVAAEAFFQKK